MLKVSGSSIYQDLFYNITVTFNGNPGTQRGLCWNSAYSVTRSDVQIVEKTGEVADFSKPLAEFEGTSKALFVGAVSHKSHKALVTGLTTGKSYYYRVGDKSRGIWSEEGVIKTGATDSSKYSVLLFADTQFFKTSHSIYGAVCQRNAFAANPDAAFGIHLGDFIHNVSWNGTDSEVEWNQYFADARDVYMNNTFVPVAGNHEGNGGLSSLFNHFNVSVAPGSSTATGIYYSFDYGDVHYICLNPFEVSGYNMTNAQKKWFAADAAPTRKKFKIALVHVSAYGGGIGNYSKLPEYANFRDYFPKMVYGAGIDLVFSGHDHCWTRSKLLKDVKGKPTEVMEEKQIVVAVDGHKVPVSVNPDGVYYIEVASSGYEQYGPVAGSCPEEFLAYNKSAGIAYQYGKTQAFAKLTVDGDSLFVAFYNHDYETGEITTVHSFGIKKG